MNLKNGGCEQNFNEMSDKNEYRYWILSVGIMLALLSEGAWIPLLAGIALIGLAAYQIWQNIQDKKASS